MPLVDGRVEVEGFDLQIQNDDVIPNGFRRMVRGQEFEVCELALTTYLCAREHGAQYTALPIPLVREFHHGAILFNRRVCAEDPRSLESKNVGVDRGFTVTTGVWVRAILAEEHGVDISKVNWILSGDEHLTTFRPPSNVSMQEPGRDMRADLVSGDIPACVGFFRHDIKDKTEDVVALHPEGLEAGLRAFDDRGHYPINHLIVVRNDVLEKYPELPVRLFDAFSASKKLYLDELRDGKIADLSPADRMHLRITERMPDPLPYGVEPNRALLENYIEHCLSQGVLNTPVKLEDVFVQSTLDLIG